MVQLDPTLENKYALLLESISRMGSVVVALSGGVDSVLLAKAAFDALGERALAVTADSPSLPRRELQAARRMALQIGIRHEVFHSRELEDSRYAANPQDRCYFCKKDVFQRMDELAARLGYVNLVYGENVDDQSDHRPGATAAQEHRVRSPLKEAGLNKAEIRALAQHFGLPVWDKPSSACLASRFPYGSQITPEKLAQVEAAEDLLWQLGFRQFRVRHHDNLARIEVGLSEMPAALSNAKEIVAAFLALGYTFVTLDLAGYRMGSFNQGLAAPSELRTAGPND